MGLKQTTLPRGPDVPGPFVHGYQYEPESGEYADVIEVLAGGWAWAAGGMVSTPAELNRFVRRYVGGELFDAGVQAQQRDFRAGSSEPTGPGENAAGLALFRYRTSCGVVLGHTGNTVGYTQFIAASPDGSRSVTVSMTVRRTQGDEGPAAEVFAGARRRGAGRLRGAGRRLSSGDVRTTHGDVARLVARDLATWPARCRHSRTRCGRRHSERRRGGAVDDPHAPDVTGT